MPALANKILHYNADAMSFNKKFHNCGEIGRMKFLEKSTRPDLAYATHLCA